MPSNSKELKKEREKYNLKKARKESDQEVRRRDKETGSDVLLMKTHSVKESCILDSAAVGGKDDVSSQAIVENG